MFTFIPGRTTLGVPPENVVAIIESINAPNISIPDLGTEPTKAYLVGCVTPGGGACVFCYLLLLETNRAVVYISNPPEVAFDQYANLEVDAIQFAESMGFMLDNMNYRAQAPEKQRWLVETLPFFRELQPSAPRTLSPGTAMTGAGAVAAPAPSATELASVARLLSSF